MGQFRPIWRGARRVGVASCVAMVVIAVGMRVNREVPSSSAVDERLRERAADVTIDMRSLEDAVRSLQSSFKTKVELKTQNHWVGSGIGELRLRNTTLGQAVAAVIRRFDEKAEELSYEIDGDRVKIIASEDESREIITRVYDVGEHLRDPLTAPEYMEAFSGGHMESPAEAMVNIAASIIEAEKLDIYGGSIPARLAVRGRWLVVRAPESMQHKIEMLMLVMRHPAGAGAGKNSRRPE